MAVLEDKLHDSHDDLHAALEEHAHRMDEKLSALDGVHGNLTEDVRGMEDALRAQSDEIMQHLEERADALNNGEYREKQHDVRNLNCKCASSHARVHTAIQRASGRRRNCKLH